MESVRYEPGTSMDLVDRTGPFVGASDAPVIALGNVYGKTPTRLYLEKIGKAPGFSGNKFTELGNLLEPFVREWAASYLGRRIEVVPPWVPHPKRPWQRASLDGWILPAGGHNGITVQIKTTRNIADWGPSWSSEADAVPRYVQVQCQHEMDVYDASRALVIVVGTQDFAERVAADSEDFQNPAFVARLVGMLEKRCYELWRDRPFLDDLVEAEEQFVECVRSLTPPAELSLEDVKLLYPKGETGTALEATRKVYELARKVKAAREKAKEADAAKKQAEAALGAALKGCSRATFQGKEIVTWSNNRGFDLETFRIEHPALYESYCRSFDAAGFKEDYPDLREAYMKPGIGQRVMLLKEVE